MMKHLPSWLERWLDVQSDSSGEGTLWRLEYAWKLAPWLTLSLVVSGAIYVAFLYSRERASAGSLVRVFLACQRIAALAIVAWMLAAWMLALERSGLPYAVVMIDDSASMATVDRYHEPDVQQAVDKYAGSDASSPVTRLQWAQALLTSRNAAALRKTTAEQRLRIYAVSSATRRLDGDLHQLIAEVQSLEPTGELSRLGDGISSVLDELRGTPPSAIVLISDGVNTAGESLIDAAQAARRNGVPLFTVAIGNSQPVKDIEVADLLVDEIVFVNDVVNFEFTVTATGFRGQVVAAQLVNAQSGEALAETPVTLGADGLAERVRIAYRPPEVGDFELAVRIAPLADELNSDNNSESRTIQVRKDKLRVLMVWWQPSLEFRRLKALLERESTVELKTVLQDADLEYTASDRTALKVFPAEREELLQFDVILFGDANPQFLPGQTMDHLRDFVTEKGGGLVVIAGPRFTPRAFAGTPLEKLLPVELEPTALSPAAPAKEGFVPRLTDLGAASAGGQIGDSIADVQQTWERLPPWFWFDPPGRARPGARVFLEHPTQLGADGRPRPLVAMQFVGAGKVLYHAGDESYRWRFRVGDTYFGRYWVQSIRYLSRSRNRDENHVAELTVDRREYQRGESPRLRVQFADDRAAPAEDSGVSLAVERQGQRVQTLDLTRNASERGSFEGALTRPAEGKYRVWISAPTMTGQAPSVDFRVLPPPGETQRIQADASELQRAAEITHGRFYTPVNVDDLWRDLPPGRQIPVETLPPIPLWNQWPVLALVLLLLVTEWLVRKRVGLL